MCECSCERLIRNCNRKCNYVSLARFGVSLALCCCVCVVWFMHACVYEYLYIYIHIFRARRVVFRSLRFSVYGLIKPGERARVRAHTVDSCGRHSIRSICVVKIDAHMCSSMCASCARVCECVCVFELFSKMHMDRRCTLAFVSVCVCSPAALEFECLCVC